MVRKQEADRVDVKGDVQMEIVVEARSR